MDKFFLADGNGFLMGPYEHKSSPNAEMEKRIPFAKELLPLTDRRGCPRWRWTGKAAEAIPPAERCAPTDITYPLWKELLSTELLLAHKNVQEYPQLAERLEQEIAALRARVDEMMTHREDD